MLALQLVAIGILAQGPGLGLIHEIALADVKQNVPVAEQPYTRYISLHGVPEEDRRDFGIALLMALNGASIRGEFHRPRPIAGGRLLRLNLKGLGWDRFSREIELDKLAGLGVKLPFKTDRDKQFYLDFWETLGFSEPFFVQDGIYGKPARGWLNPGAAAEAKRVAHTEKLVISGHWLLPRLLLETADGGFYSSALILPPKEKDLEIRLGVNGPFIDVDLRAKHGAAIPKSASVAYNNRELQFVASSTGYDQHWYSRTLDFAKVDKANKDVRETPAGQAKHDAREILFSLPNGLMGGYLSNGDGIQQAFAPQVVAEDQREAVPDLYYSPTKTVVNFIKCLDCHGESRGLIGFKDAAIDLIVPPRLDTGYQVVGYDKKKVAIEAIRVEEFYRAGLKRKVDAYRDSYEARVKELTTLPVLEATRLVLKFYDRFTPAYASQLVSPEQAAREMALPIEGARALWRASQSNQMNFLAAEQGITRTRFEQTVGESLRLDVIPVKVTPSPK